MHSLRFSYLLISITVYLFLLIDFSNQEGPSSHGAPLIEIDNSKLSYPYHIIIGKSPGPINGSIIESPEKDLLFQKRRVPVRTTRPPQPTTSTQPEQLHTFTFYKWDIVWTDTELEQVKWLLRKFPEVFAFGLVGIELEPRHNIYLRWGALTLNLYAIAEALTQTVVLAVFQRLAQMASHGVICLGYGEVVVGAGVRVLFAASIRLQGLEDVHEMIIQPLDNLIG